MRELLWKKSTAAILALPGRFMNACRSLINLESFEFPEERRILKRTNEAQRHTIRDVSKYQDFIRAKKRCKNER